MEFDWISEVRSHFNKKREFLIKQLRETEKSRDASAAPTESHSDTSRSQLEKLAFALKVEIEIMNKYISLIPKSDSKKTKDKIDTWKYVELELGKEKMKLLLVPQGMGGERFKDVRLLSVASKLGVTILGKKPKDKLEFNNQTVKISSVR